MKNIFFALIAILLFTGCATTAGIESLETRVGALESQISAANDAAEAMALATDLQLDEQVRSDVADYFIAAANDLLAAEQYDAARQLTAALRMLLGDDLPEKLAQQLIDIEENARNATQATDAAE